MRERGLTIQGLLVCVAVLIVFAGILYGVGRVALDGGVEKNDIRKMRHIYVAISMYQSTNDGLPPLDLLAVRRDLGDDAEFLAENDPNRSGTSFPIDPALPEYREKSPIRISFSYLVNWIRAGKAPATAWQDAQTNHQHGLLASPWYGDKGPIIRLNMDGSVFRLEKRSNMDRLTFTDLFTGKHSTSS